MASASEQLARNMNWGTFAKAKELHQRLLFTLMILVVYRIGTYIPIPGVNLEAFGNVMGNAEGGGLLDRLNLFSGGAVERMAIFALNVMPYITASIIMTLMKGSSRDCSVHRPVLLSIRAFSLKPVRLLPWSAEQCS